MLMNHIGSNEEDTLGSSIGSSDGITYGKTPVGSLLDIILSKIPYADVGGSGCGP